MSLGQNCFYMTPPKRFIMSDQDVQEPQLLQTVLLYTTEERNDNKNKSMGLSILPTKTFKQTKM